MCVCEREREREREREGGGESVCTSEVVLSPQLIRELKTKVCLEGLG